MAPPTSTASTATTSESSAADNVRDFAETDWTVGALAAGRQGSRVATPWDAVKNLLFHAPLPGGVMTGKMGVRVDLDGPQRGGGVEFAVRSARSPGALLTSLDPAKYRTMRDVFTDTCARHAELRCMGSRPILRMRVEAGVEKYVLGPYEWISFQEAHAYASDVGLGLASVCGLAPGDMVNFFADTSAKWHLAMQACFRHGFVVTTTYANLGEDAVEYAIQQAEVSTVFTDAALAAGIVARVVARCPKVKHVVFIEDRRPCTHATFVADEDVKKAMPRGVKAHALEEIRAAGAAAAAVAAAPPALPNVDPNSPCVIMYTSGSTARPKGVIISHANLLAVMCGTTRAMPAMGPSDTYVGYLPLAHILEMIAELGTLQAGGSIGYGSPKTLSDAGVSIDPDTCRGDAPELKPTLMAAVPMVFDKIRAAVLAKVAATGGIAAKLFAFALERKIRALESGHAAPLWDLLVFDKLRARLLGGRVRFMLSGGGPLSRETQVFMNVVCNCPVGQGYGLTESCGAVTTVWPNDRSYGRCGAPIECNQVALVDWEDGGYYADPARDPAKESKLPRGEIVVGGHNITMGYYKMPDETAKAYFCTPDGMRWFRTGDVGEVYPNGTLRLIDRKKELVKLSGGEYVSYGKLEPLLRESKFVDNGFIYANSEASFCVAVVTPRPTLQAVPSDADVLADITSIFKANRCQAFEIPKRVRVVTDVAWTPESDLVTAALKLKRHNLQKHYKGVVEELYR